MPCSGCSALHGGNPNSKKKEKFYKDLELPQVRILNDITLLLSLKFECANYLFPTSSILFTIHVPAEYWFSIFC